MNDVIEELSCKLVSRPNDLELPHISLACFTELFCWKSFSCPSVGINLSIDFMENDKEQKSNKNYPIGKLGLRTILVVYGNAKRWKVSSSLCYVIQLVS